MKQVETYHHMAEGRSMLTTGEKYTGNQMYAGNGVTRFCALCGDHKLMIGGHLKHVMGLRQWVCGKHPKVKSCNT